LEPLIKFKSLPEQVCDYLSEAIIEGKIKPAEKLVENDLCHQFGISRSTLRECFRILEATGLITINPRKETSVRGLSSKEIEDAFHVSTSLQSLAARLAVPNFGEKEIRTLNDLIQKMEEAIKKQEIKSLLRLNSEFHSTIIKASNNQILENILTNLGKGLWLRITFLYYQSQSELIFSNEMHKKITGALERKDAADVQKLIEEHMNHAREYLLKSFNRNASNSIS
jgi:DNA-binding GntR family transcriptional regulator